MLPSILGLVLVLLATCSQAPTGPGLFSATGSMTGARWAHTATLLHSGKVVVAGGVGASLRSPVPGAELYDPGSGTFASTGTMLATRCFQTATLLPDGRVLVAGGEDASEGLAPRLASAELFDPPTGTFAATGSMTEARSRHSATLLLSGKVLIVGGWGGGDIGGSPLPVASAELYDPASGTFTATGPMTTARVYHTATLLLSGNVLIAGGADYADILSSAELYDPASETFTATGGMSSVREGHTATLLPNGTVLVAGGADETDALSSAELYDPASGTFVPTGAMTATRGSHTATLLQGGKVLVAGGGGASDVANGRPPSLSSAERYDPATGAFTATGAMTTERSSHTATLLPSGKVLMAGGRVLIYSFGGPDGTLSSAELYY